MLTLLQTSVEKKKKEDGKHPTLLSILNKRISDLVIQILKLKMTFKCSDKSDELHEEVGDESSEAEPQTQAGHHQVGRGAGLLPRHHLWAGDHADGADVAVTDTEEHHDDDVGGVTLEGHGGYRPVGGPNVAVEEERKEDKSKHTI